MKQSLAQRHFLIIVAVIFILGTLIYSNTFNAPFVFDDEPFIVHNKNIKDLSDVEAIWHAAPVPSRFISFLSFAVNYHFHGLDVPGYHIVNILIHVINAVLVYWLMTITLRTGMDPPLLAASIALLFFVHPIQTQAVTYITQRFTSLATLFYLATLCCYALGRRQRRPIYYAAAVISGVLAMFTKEIAITLPVAVILYDRYFLNEVGAPPRGRPVTGGHRGPPLRWILILIFLLIIPAVFSFNAADILTIEHRSGSFNGEPINNKTYLLTQFRVIWTYVKLLFVPLNQNLLYEFAASRSLSEMKTLLGFLALVALAVFAYLIRKKERLISFGICWFLLTLSVESSVIVIRHVIFEHRVYLPSVGFFMVFVGSIWWLTNGERSRHLFMGIMIVLITVYSFLTYERNKVWQNKVSLWSDVVKKSPGLLKAHLTLGVAHTDAGNYLEAMKIYDALIAQAPNAEAFSNRGNVYSRLGEYDLAIEDYTKSLAINPRSAMAYTNRGDSHYNQGRFSAAVEDYTKAIEVNPDYYLAYTHRANAFRSQKKFTLAENDYNEAIRKNPYNSEPFMGMGIAAFLQRDYARANDYFSEVLQRQKDNVSALINRANALSELGRLDEAMGDYDRAARLQPGNGQIYYNRGILWQKKKDAQRARSDLEKAGQLGYEPLSY